MSRVGFPEATSHHLGPAPSCAMDRPTCETSSRHARCSLSLDVRTKLLQDVQHHLPGRLAALSGGRKRLIIYVHAITYICIYIYICICICVCAHLDARKLRINYVPLVCDSSTICSASTGGTVRQGVFQALYFWHVRGTRTDFPCQAASRPRILKRTRGGVESGWPVVEDPKDPSGKEFDFAYQNSWGLTQRTIGVMAGSSGCWWEVPLLVQSMFAVEELA